MQVICELSKEFVSLPQDEAESCFHAEMALPHDVLSNEDVFLATIEASSHKLFRIASRLSLTFNLGKLMCISSTEKADLLHNAREIVLPEEGSIGVSYRNRSQCISSQDVITPLSKILTKNRSVDLSCPDIRIRVIINDTAVYVMQVVHTIDRSDFEKRKAQYRPFFSPISLHPKLARALVNITKINQSSCILDPFCGTGGFLLEAGLIGATLIGCDIEDKMIRGCEKTLTHYGIKGFDLICADVGTLEETIDQVDAIVTDLPYGKSTTTRGESLQELVSRAYQQFSKILAKDGKAVVGSHSPDLLQIGTKHLNLQKMYSIPVHQSLTRYFGVFQPNPKSF